MEVAVFNNLVLKAVPANTYSCNGCVFISLCDDYMTVGQVADWEIVNDMGCCFSSKQVYKFAR